MATAEAFSSTHVEAREESLRNRQIGYVLFRLTLGLDIFFHGFMRILTGTGKFVANTEKLFTNSFLPMWQVHIFLSVLPFIEVIVGVCLVVGLLTLWALIAGALLMMVLIFGTATRQDWNTVATQLLYGFFYYFLIIRLQDNCFALDKLRKG